MVQPSMPSNRIYISFQDLLCFSCLKGFGNYTPFPQACSSHSDKISHSVKVKDMLYLTQRKQVKINFHLFRGKHFHIFARMLLRCKAAKSHHFVTRKLSLLCCEGDGSSALIISHLWWELGILTVSLPSCFYM